MIEILNGQWIDLEDSLGVGYVADLNNLLGQLTKHHKEYSKDDIGRLLEQDDLYLFAYIDDDTGMIVGMASLKIDGTRMLTQDYSQGFVGDVVVDKIFRGRGIARELMNFLIQTARYMHLKHISLTSNPDNLERASAIRLYEKLGFKLIGKLYQSNYYRLVL